MTFPHDADTLVPRHAEDETLLAYLDGELDADTAARTADHLEQCWQCRSRMNGLESSIHEFLAVREQLLPTDVTPAGPAEVGFRCRLSEHAAEVLPKPALDARLAAWRVRLGEWAGRMAPLPSVRYALAGMATIAVVAAGVATWWSEPVSASEVLARSEVRELFDIRCSNLVVRTVVHVDLVDVDGGASTRLGVIETHTDPLSSALSVSVRLTGGAHDSAVLWGRDALEDRPVIAGVLPDQLARFLQSRRWAPGVSISGYLRMVADRGDTAASAMLDGDIYQITHQFMPGHPSGIVETRLHVDGRTWLPIQVSFLTRDGAGRHEFRFIRGALEFLPRTPDYARLFASARPEPARAAVARRGSAGGPRADAARLSRPMPLAWESAPATDQEAAAAIVLHALKADLGEEVNVFPLSDGSVLVQGLVDTDARRQAITRALGELPAPLHAEIHTPIDLPGDAVLFDPPWRAFTDVEAPSRPLPGAPVRVVDTGGLRMPMQKRLEEHVARNLRESGADPSPGAVSREVAGFANDVVSGSRLALFHAWALYRLDQQFSPARSGGLSTASLEQVAGVRRSHRDTVMRMARELAARIGPVAGPRGPVAREAGAEPDTQTLLRLVSDADALVRELFTMSAPGADSAPSLFRLAVLLEQLG